MPSYKYTSVDDYISRMPEEQRALLEKLRSTIRKAIPEAEEVISYNMPAYHYHGVLVYFALSANHIGFYPTPSGIETFKHKLKNYKFAKGSVQFPLNGELPERLIADMARFRFEENHKKMIQKSR